MARLSTTGGSASSDRKKPTETSNPTPRQPQAEANSSSSDDGSSDDDRDEVNQVVGSVKPAEKSKASSPQAANTTAATGNTPRRRLFSESPKSSAEKPKDKPGKYNHKNRHSNNGNKQDDVTDILSNLTLNGSKTNDSGSPKSNQQHPVARPEQNSPTDRRHSSTNKNDKSPHKNYNKTGFPPQEHQNRNSFNHNTHYDKKGFPPQEHQNRNSFNHNTHYDKKGGPPQEHQNRNSFNHNTHYNKKGGPPQEHQNRNSFNHNTHYNKKGGPPQEHQNRNSFNHNTHYNKGGPPQVHLNRNSFNHNHSNNDNSNTHHKKMDHPSQEQQNRNSFNHNNKPNNKIGSPPQEQQNKSSSGFFEKLHAPKPQKHQQHQNHSQPGSNSHVFGQTSNMKNPLAEAGLRPSNDHRKKQPVPHQSQLPNQTFNSPVRSFKPGSGSFMEIMTPKSSQWGQRPSNFEALKKESVESPSKNFFGDSQIDSLAYNANTWGTRSNYIPPSMIHQRQNYTARAGNSYAYVSPSKAADAIKDLLENFDNDDDDEYSGKSNVEGLNVQLLPHQTKGLKFLLKREARDLKGKGGLLCDDMGLGKTIQSMALILSNPLTKQYSQEEIKEYQAKSTLVIAPLALTTQWAREMNDKAPGLRVYVHHGPKRTKSSAELTNFDVVITTYQVVNNERQNKGPLFEINWLRIIIDEAHTIKNKNSQTAMACSALVGISRWCLTGTPIQNNADELYSLINFLKIDPYYDYKVWNEQISKPIKFGKVNVAMNRLHVFLGAIMLRRTKAILDSSGISLPERNIHRTFIKFDKGEQHFYEKLEKKIFVSINDMFTEGKGGYIGALLLLLRLRQVCDHMDLATGRIDADDEESVASAVEKTSPKSSPSKKESDNGDDLSDMLKDLSIEKDKNQEYLHEFGLDERAGSSNSLDNTGTSSKIRKLLEILSTETSRKTIVFSQFTSMLDILEPCLKKNNIGYVRYDGSMKPKDRDRSLERLRGDESVTVLLCSLKCGALGLNLTCANRVILVDPWWNPMISEQAIDRVHRLGQTHRVDVYELIVEESVEQRILELQDKKRKLADGIIDGSGIKEINNKLSLSELLSLFR